MVAKPSKIRPDDLSYWNVTESFNNNEMENVDDEERSIALSVNLLLKNKNISSSDLLRLSSHFVTSEKCQCYRSFHIFCTDFFHKNDQDIEMIHIHPAPRTHERDPSRRTSTPYKKYHQRHQEDSDEDAIGTARSEPCHTNTPENQLLEKKLPIPPKLPSRTTSLNIPASYHSFQRSIQTSRKYSPRIRLTKQTIPNTQLFIRALSVFDQSPSASQLFIPRGPPPSPKTPTQESSTILLNTITTTPFRAKSITPRVKNSNENTKKLTNSSSVKVTKYVDHARDYLSASDCSDKDEDDKDQNIVLTKIQPKLPIRNQSLSRSGTVLRDRILLHNTNRYLGLAEVYYSPLDVQKNLSDKSRRYLRSQTRITTSTNENDDASTNTTKITATTKATPVPQSKSVFGFSRTASSMHFGHAAGRLGLQGSFEKWPPPLSRRTPFERKQEVTTLRLVTLPLVTS